MSRGPAAPAAWALLFGLGACTPSSCPCSGPLPPPPPASAEAAAQPTARLDLARLTAVAQRLDALADEFFRFWVEHGPDREHGGFFGTLDREGKPTAPTTKGLIQEARHLFSMSLWYERRGRDPAVKALADDLYAFLDAHFRDGDGEYFFKVDEAGKVVEPKKVLYAESFAIYALSTYGRVFAVDQAKRQALACFRSLDARAHDAKNGGYDQRRDPAWLTPGAEKETNTHLHLMESFATLYEVTGDPLARERALELVRVFTDHIVQPAGYAAKEFLLDWKRYGEPAVSYGHDLETAWLLLDAARALGHPNDGRVREVASRIGKNSATAGYDAALGGYFEEGPPGGAPVKREKIWWIEAEALPSLFRQYELSSDPLFLERLERTVGFIETHQRDPRFGGWYWGLLEDGRVGPHGDNKGEEWKASYHELRALLLTSDWIRELGRR